MTRVSPIISLVGRPATTRVRALGLRSVRASVSPRSCCRGCFAATEKSRAYVEKVELGPGVKLPRGL